MGLIDFLFKGKNKDFSLDVSFSSFNNYDIFFVKGKYIYSWRNGITKEIIGKRNNGKNLIVDLKDVEEFDTSGLASLVNVWKIVKKEGNEFGISGANKRVIDYFIFYNLYSLFDFYKDLGDCFEKQNSISRIREKSKLRYY